MPLTFSAAPLATARRPTTFAVLKSLVRADNASPTFGGGQDTLDAFPGQDEASGQIVINFPCMPDTIELARKASYTNQLPTPITPDGYFTYNYTEPLRIPITFSVHGYDENYCQQWGPLMLLSIAAKLHALVMPIQKGGALVTQAAVDPEKAKLNTTPAATPGTNFTGGDVQGGRQVSGQYHFPPPVSLNIMMAQLGRGNSGSVNASNALPGAYGMRSLGINCVGFLEDVRVVFKGPWLQGSYGTNGIRNLPSEAEFGFTFVHVPGYTNNIELNSDIVTTSAREIYLRLYNTADIVRNEQNYADLNDLPWEKAGEITGKAAFDAGALFDEEDAALVVATGKNVNDNSRAAEAAARARAARLKARGGAPG